MKNTRRNSIIIILVVLLGLTFFQVVEVAAQSKPVGTGGLIDLGIIEQLVRLIFAKAFLYSFGG
jgi:hypothetical protein